MILNGWKFINGGYIYLSTIKMTWDIGLTTDTDTTGLRTDMDSTDLILNPVYIRVTDKMLIR